MVKAQPDQYSTVTPYLIAEGASKLIDFIEKAFGAKTRMSMPGPDGSIAHAEVEIGDSIIMLADASGEYPLATGMLHLYVDDCDATYQAALAAGATSSRELKTEFYGDRSGGVKDEWGNTWWITTHVEDVSPEEMERRSQEWAAQQG